MSVNKEFLTKLTDQELAAIYLDRKKQYEKERESLIWVLCDKHDEEYGSEDSMVLIEEMDEALTTEMLDRFVSQVITATKK